MIAFTPLRIVLLVAAGLVGALVGALTGAFYGILGWMGVWPAIILGTLGALIIVVEVNEVSNVQRIRLAIGMLLGAGFGVIWAQLSGGALAPTLGHTANWAAYGFFASSITRDTLLKVRRWAMGGAIGGAIFGVIWILLNGRVAVGPGLIWQSANSLAEALGTLVYFTLFGAFWVSAYGLLQLSADNRRSASATTQSSQSTSHRLRPIRKVVR
jgi:hypothetical protein